MVRAIEGHGLRITSKPPFPVGTWWKFPLASGRVTTSGWIPKNGRVADPGLAAMAPGIGVIMIAPVSVCHHVSTMGQRLCPIFSRYHIHASGLIGSPTVPSRRSESSLYLLTNSAPHLINARIAVGAV